MGSREYYRIIITWAFENEGNPKKEKVDKMKRKETFIMELAQNKE